MKQIIRNGIKYNRALEIITGTGAKTPIDVLEVSTGIRPLKLRN